MGRTFQRVLRGPLAPLARLYIRRLVPRVGAWLAGENRAEAGLMMPGEPAVGIKYYQEIAPGVAMDEVLDSGAAAKVYETAYDLPGFGSEPSVADEQ